MYQTRGFLELKNAQPMEEVMRKKRMTFLQTTLNKRMYPTYHKPRSSFFSKRNRLVIFLDNKKKRTQILAAIGYSSVVCNYNITHLRNFFKYLRHFLLKNRQT